ncbi:MAG: magnesium-translocating P-type ATPase [Vicinamibacterales bacterium]
MTDDGSGGMTTYWTRTASDLLTALGTSPHGLTSAEATVRRARYGPNRLRQRATPVVWRTFAKQFKSPLLLILLFAAVASALSGEWVDSAIVLAIVAVTIAVTVTREYHADVAALALEARVQSRVHALRDGVVAPVPIEEIVPGDVVTLAAGDLVPADGVILEAEHFFVSESALTGESFPVQKRPGLSEAAAQIRERFNCVYLGANVRSGLAHCLIVQTGLRTELGAIAHTLRLAPPETEFDRGLRRFGVFLAVVMMAMLAIVFSIHVMYGRSPLETLLFAVAIAVGLSPELLPAILSINLSRAAQVMAEHGVLVRRLTAIENLGSLDVLCTDKTGTLTEGVIVLEGSYDPTGQAADGPLSLGACNARFESGLASALDDAILAVRRPDAERLTKLAEIPFDFVRKRVSVVVDDAQGPRLITKGAFHHVVDVCTHTEDGVALTTERRAALEVLYDRWSEQGIRVLAVASRQVERRQEYGRDVESDLAFAGFLTFSDRPKADAAIALATLASLGVTVKIISGDSGAVTRHMALLVGMRQTRVLTGAEIQQLDEPALWRRVETTDLFVEVDPNQKERIIRALRHVGHVVGFLGDGVNDAPAMHAADTSLSVDNAVDVARATADFVLLSPDLDVIRRGIEEGRRTFSNTLKYILTTMSANLGNMVSMAVASLVLPFLPLLPGQILLNNFLSDVPAVGLAGDAVDQELIDRPRRWDLPFIARFMVVFGAVSSVFDLLTFGVLLRVFESSPALFRTAWFVESLLTELLVALIVRTRRPFFRSRPGRVLLLSTITLSIVAVAIPYVPLARAIGFVPMPMSLLLAVLAITAAYVVTTEAAKAFFYRRVSA